MIEVLQAGKRVGYARLTCAITRALNLGTGEAAAVHYLLNASSLEVASPPALATIEGVGSSPLLAAHFCRPLPSIAAYDSLLGSHSVRREVSG